MLRHKSFKFMRNVFPLLLFAAVTGGCASLQIPDTPHNTSSNQISATPFQTISATNIFPVKNGTGALKVTQGKHKGSVYKLTRNYKNKNWEIAVASQHRAYYTLNSKGQVVLTHEDDLEKNVRVQYSPGIVIIPAKLKETGNYPKGTVKVTVLNLKTGKYRASGNCSYAITNIKEVNLTTPAGTFKTYLIKSDRKMNLTLAKVHVVILDGYSSGIGKVLEDVTTKTRAIGIFSDMSHSRLERAKAK